MGGAITFEGLEKEKKWNKVFSETISGKISNVYSTKDYVLLGFSYSKSGSSSAGRNRLNFEAKTDLLVHSDTLLSNFKNYNITNFADVQNGGIVQMDAGHLDYRGEILAKVMEML